MTIEREQTATAAVTEVQELKDLISQLTEQVAVLTTTRNMPKHNTVTNNRCFYCRGFGHLQQDCPTPGRPQANYRRISWSCRQQGHIPCFLEMSPYFEIPPPLKCRRMFLQTHRNKRRPRNLAAW